VCLSEVVDIGHGEQPPHSSPSWEVNAVRRADLHGQHKHRCGSAGIHPTNPDQSPSDKACGNDRGILGCDAVRSFPSGGACLISGTGYLVHRTCGSTPTTGGVRRLQLFVPRTCEYLPHLFQWGIETGPCAWGSKPEESNQRCSQYSGHHSGEPLQTKTSRCGSSRHFHPRASNRIKTSNQLYVSMSRCPSQFRAIITA
jgi:hypothetical protein